MPGANNNAVNLSTLAGHGHASRMPQPPRRYRLIVLEDGSPGRIRTAGQAVNSRLLYR